EGEILLNENKTKNEEKSENFSEFSFRFYPAKRIIAGQIKAENLAEKTYIEIETEDKRIEKELKEGYTNLCFELDENASLPLDAVCRVKRGDKVLQEEKLTVKSIPPKPDYMNTQAGKGISVPSPWKKPDLDDNRIILSN
ncbi:MAG: hypothetical protein KBT47_02640, partial [Armatimonadetes bacterium]|nr:hypothetical protein [Candidatus Hippobium faecium]